MSLSTPLRAHQQTLAALRLSRQPGVGAAMFRALVAAHGTPEDALSAYLQRGMREGRRKSGTSEGLRLASLMLEAGELGAVHLGGEGYPQRCLSLGEPPPVLFLRGSASALLGRSVALVGARAVDERAKDETSALAALAAEAGCVVVSGGARGIDAAAHRGALRAGGETVAVLGTGMDVVYPPEHGALFDDIAACGALVTELLPGAPPMASFFLTRNRIIAALSDALVLVRGDHRSGAISTARWAMKLGRPVAVVEASGTLGEAGRLLASQGAARLSSRASFEAFLASLPGG